MSKKPFEFSVFIGRFEPIHIGHQLLIEEGLKQAEKLIIVLGSHNKSRSVKNPWSSEERIKMISSSLSPSQLNRITFVSVRDYLYNESLWVADIKNKINEITEYADDTKIALIGFKSDSSSYYLDSFPNWKYVSCPTNYEIHASNIRNSYFILDSSYKEYLHPEVVKYLEEFKKTDIFNNLKNEYEYIDTYKEAWRGAPFVPTFVTVDAVVIKSGHILLVKRGKNFGKGLLALPGGFLNQDERILDGAIRELKEETLIQTSKEELQKAIVDQKVFDYPYRSARGRCISHAFLINLGSGPLDKVKGSDDAEKSWWMPLNEFYSREKEFFEDHFQIITYFCNKF